MKRVIILVVLIVVVAVAWYAWTKYDERTPDVVNRKPDVSVDAASLVAAFEQDTASASGKYIDKIVEVTGNVKKIDTSGAVILGEPGTLSEVVVGLDRRHMQDYKQLKEGSRAVLQGICSGYSTGGGDDLLSSLGTTVELKQAGVKNSKQ